MSDFLPFSVPDIGEEEIAEVVDTLRSGWITTGPKCKKFESEFRAFIGGPVEAIAVNSATAGLHLALEAVGVGPKDEVITTVYTFTATAEVVRYLGADPVFVDIDPTTMNMDITCVDAAITERTKVILPVHFGGLPCDMDKIVTIARSRGIRIVEDAAHAFPATYHGRAIGSMESDAAVFSFYATKTITTGEGGMIVTKDRDVAERCRVMRLHGISRDSFDRYISPKASWYYEVIAPGFKYNMTDLAASLGIHQIHKARAFQVRRAELAARYKKGLKGLPLLCPPDAPGGDTHAWHLFVIRLQDAACVSRDRFIELMAEKGIGCSVHFIPLHLHPFWRDRYGYRPEAFSNSFRAFQQAVSLPIYARMTNEDQDRVIGAVRSILA